MELSNRICLLAPNTSEEQLNRLNAVMIHIGSPMVIVALALYIKRLGDDNEQYWEKIVKDFTKGAILKLIDGK